MKLWMLLACIITECLIYAIGNQLLIGAFNIQTFGRKKMRNEAVVQVLVQVTIYFISMFILLTCRRTTEVLIRRIINRYDILLIQEIRDRTNTAFPQLMSRLDQHNAILSPRLGRSSYREQYAFVFKEKVVQPLHSYLYPDRDDLFAREPLTIHFKRRATSIGIQRDFIFIGIHVRPRSAIHEINALTRVYDKMVSHFQKTNVLIGGDLNADCRYVCASCWSRIRLKTNSTFTWLIDSSADTTTKTSTDCAYDRLIVAGSEMKRNSINPQVFRFDDVYNLTYSQAKKVSDHYPVEFYLK